MKNIAPHYTVLYNIYRGDFMKNNIRLVLEDGTFEDGFIDNEYGIYIYINDRLAGDIIGFADEESIHIEVISLKEEYRRKGYGTIALNQLKEIGKSLGVSYIEGDCRNELIPFYKKLEADFNPRNEEDLTYINNRFYIDL